MITRVSKVIVPVLDQQAALDFWTTCMEFVIVRDDSYGDERWIEINPPNQGLLLVRHPWSPPQSTSATSCRTRTYSSERYPALHER